MELNVAIRKRIEYFMNLKEMNIYQLSKVSGLTVPTLSTFLKKKTNKLIQLDSLLHVCEGFGITLEDFFDDKIFNEIL